MTIWQVAAISIGGGLILAFITALGYVDLSAWGKPRPVRIGCRNCGKGDRLYHYQDGGHDYCEGCDHCGAVYGVQDEPFNMVKRIK